MEQINTIDKISAVYRNTAEEARQELNKVQQKIYRIGSLRLLLFVAGVVGIIYFWSESWGILACIALITLLPFLFLMKYHNRLFHRITAGTAYRPSRYLVAAVWNRTEQGTVAIEYPGVGNMPAPQGGMC